MKDQVNKILEFSNIDKRFGLIIFIMLITGLRSGEIRALKYSDYNFSEKCFYINKAIKSDNAIGSTKNGKSRIVIVPEQYIETIEKSIIGNDPNTYFCGCNTYITAASFRSRYLNFFYRLNRYCTEMNIERVPSYSPHSTRHTYITGLLGKGVPIAIVAALVGHSSFEVTSKYTHLNQLSILHKAIDNL